MHHRGNSTVNKSEIEGREVLITGSSSGIGRAISEHLLELGARVVGIARDHKKFLPNTNMYTPYTVDVTELDELPRFIKKILSNHPNLNGFVANAGYGQFDGLENFSPSQISSYINTNLTSHVIITRLILPVLKTKKQGDIVFIGSEAALSGTKKATLYCATKFALRGFSQALREECADKNLRVGLVNPGMTKTPFFKNLSFSPGDDPLNTVHLDDIAGAVISIFLAKPGTVIEEVKLAPLKKVIKFD
ncbi:MAG: hypothetical protein CMF70_08425 [Magnetovibrio sp.]|nr:hypothetical protein [Magnetovibrio sp.]